MNNDIKRILNLIETQIKWERHENYSHMESVRFSKENDYKSPTFSKEIGELLIEQFVKKEPDLLKNGWDFLGIQKYNPGDHFPKHTDVFNWQRLLILKDSDHGLWMESRIGDPEFIKDVSGNIIEVPMDVIHWVEKVKEVRYSVVLGGI